MSRPQLKVVEMVQPTLTPPPHKGNISELDELETIVALRLLIHSRLREWIARKRTFKQLALKANLSPSTVSRAAYYVSNRTQTGTIHALAPHLGIKLNLILLDDW